MAAKDGLRWSHRTEKKNKSNVSTRLKLLLNVKGREF